MVISVTEALGVFLLMQSLQFYMRIVFKIEIDGADINFMNPIYITSLNNYGQNANEKMFIILGANGPMR